MAEQKPRGAGLTREKVLSAALEIADSEGLEALSFRRLAAHFGVTPMALYRYVESKDALFDSLGDLVLGELELPESEGGDWRQQLRAVAHSFRERLIAHPSVIAIFLSRPMFTPAATRTAEAMLGLLRSAGFPPERAVLLYQQIVRYLLALALLETGGGPRLSADERRQQARMALITLETLPPEQYPNLVAAAPYLAAPHDPAAGFDQSLDLLIEGLERQRPAGRRSRARG